MNSNQATHGSSPSRHRVDGTTSSPRPDLWIVGCGDIGRRMLRRYTGRGGQAVALVRNESSATACADLGAHAVCMDLDDSSTFEGLGPGPERVVYLAPPPGDGVRDPRIRAFLDHFETCIKRLVLVSTTGVYGDCEGEWIDEDTPAEPMTYRGRRRLDAETAVIDWAERHGGGYVILRVPGIYAEDRLPLERLKKQLPVVRESEAAYTNRIHAEDLARICMTALDSTHTALVLNATDGHPTTMTEYFNRVADAVGLQRPPQISLEEAKRVLSPGMLSYAMESRKICNRRLLQSFLLELEYPNLEYTLSRIDSPGRNSIGSN